MVAFDDIDFGLTPLSLYYYYIILLAGDYDLGLCDPNIHQLIAAEILLDRWPLLTDFRKLISRRIVCGRDISPIYLIFHTLDFGC